MKITFIVLSLIFILLSCESSSDNDDCKGGTSDGVCIVRCDTNQDCSNKDGLTICVENECIEDFCNTKNGYENCGEDGVCQSFRQGYLCTCPDDKLTYGNRDVFRQGNDLVLGKCLDTFTCKTSFECHHLIHDANNEGYIYFNCSPQGECVEECKLDNDCIGEFEKCGQYGCYDMKKDFEDFASVEKCGENFHFSPYVNSFYHCEAPCNDDCDLGYRCNNKKECVPTCITNEDCINDKFSVGNTCNTELNYCE